MDKIKFKEYRKQIIQCNDILKKKEKYLYNVLINYCNKYDIKFGYDFIELYKYFIYNNIHNDISINIIDNNTDIDKLDINWNMFKKYKIKYENKIKNIIEILNIEEGIYKCNKCGSKKTYNYQLQTRGADEPMTTFIKCCNKKCNFEWKIN